MRENKKEPFIEPVNHSGNGTRGSRTTLSLIILYHIFGKNARKKYDINDLTKETPSFRGVHEYALNVTAEQMRKLSLIAGI